MCDRASKKQTPPCRLKKNSVKTLKNFMKISLKKSNTIQFFSAAFAAIEQSLFLMISHYYYVLSYIL